MLRYVKSGGFDEPSERLSGLAETWFSALVDGV